MYYAVHAGAVELCKELSTLTALELPATLVFDYPSVAEMTAALAAMLPAVPKQAAQAQPAQMLMGQPQRAAATPNERSASHWLAQVRSLLLIYILSWACPQTRRMNHWSLAENQLAYQVQEVLPHLDCTCMLMSAGAWRHQGDHGRWGQR